MVDGRRFLFVEPVTDGLESAWVDVWKVDGLGNDPRYAIQEVEECGGFAEDLLMDLERGLGRGWADEESNGLTGATTLMCVSLMVRKRARLKLTLGT